MADEGGEDESEFTETVKEGHITPLPRPVPSVLKEK
jgi:hypothetical protein